MKNIWISGSVNSGKSTASKSLGLKLKMAVIELDAFSEFVENFMSFEEYLKLNYQIIPEIVEIYNKRNIGVIIAYPLGVENYENLKAQLIKFKIFTLDPSLEIALTERGGRKLNNWERERINHHYDNNVNDNYFSIRIDTRNKSVEETVIEIIDYLE